MDIRIEMKPQLKIKADNLSTFSLAAQQNSYPLFRDLSLHYPTIEGELSYDQRPLSQLVIKLTSEPELFSPEEWPIDEIRPGQVISLQKRPLSIPHNTLFNLTEEMITSISLTVYFVDAPENVLTTKKIQISVLPANFWGGESRQPELLAAFVKPNGVYAESLVRQVTEVLAKGSHGRSADGYQSNTREKPLLNGGCAVECYFCSTLSLRITSTKLC